jgi:hypothetical protein
MLLTLVTVLTLILCFLPSVQSACECGFIDEQRNVWMDAIVLPFNKVSQLADPENPDVWLPDYFKPKAFGNHTYPIIPSNTYLENDQLVLKVNKPEGLVIKSSELATRRKDLYHGTYRSRMKLPAEHGTCVGFFHYHNDTEEIDIEYLGQKPKMLYLSTKRTNPIDNSLHVDNDNHLFQNGSLHVFRDYRFDWFQNRVDFYVDNVLLYSTVKGVPSTPGRAIFMHWANGDPHWSSLPSQDVFAHFTNLRTFFNSSEVDVINNYNKACSLALERGINDAYCHVDQISSTEHYGKEHNAIEHFRVTERVGKGMYEKTPYNVRVRVSSAQKKSQVRLYISLFVFVVYCVTVSM